jgi:uncharacterized RDD family membrane protein YckC
VTEAAEAAQAGQPQPSSPTWREELAERVENFRRRRARIQRGADADLNLDFDFTGSPATSSESASDHELDQPGQREIALEPPVGTRAAGLETFAFDTTAQDVATFRIPPLDVPLGGPPPSRGASRAWDELSPEGGQADSSPAGAEAAAHFEERSHRKVPRVAPVEIILEPNDSWLELGYAASAAGEAQCAPVGRRFLAGIVDALILLVAVALFGATFWLAGVRLSLNPINIGVLGLIGVFLFLAYFGSFTAVTAATPGLSSLGIRVCSREGTPPTGRESCWRAFGYLISVAALLLGFVWAVFDSEGLTWHDRMSGTFLIRADGR